jgi:hypothetical protein
MIDANVMARVATSIAKRHAPAFETLRAEYFTAHARAKVDGWRDGEIVEFLRRAEALGTARADALVTTMRGFLAPYMVTPAGRTVVNQQLDRARAEAIELHRGAQGARAA